MTTTDSDNAFRAPRRRARRLLRAALVPLAGLLFLVAAAPAAAKKDGLVVTLEFIPTEAEEVLESRGVVPVGGPPFEILMVADARPEKDDRIGRNIEKGANLGVKARSPITPWVTQVLATSFRDWGTPSTPGADFLLEPELVKLFVVEEHTYKAEVTMKFRLKRRDGTEIWSGVAGGAASRFGRSYKESNYQEVLSDALLSCISKFWADPGFRKAWATGRGPDSLADISPDPTPAETLSPEAAKAKLLELKIEGFEDDMLSAWVRKIAFTRPLTADDLIDWRRAGIPQAAIKATMD